MSTRATIIALKAALAHPTVANASAKAVFWHLASVRKNDAETASPRTGRWWTVLVGVATMVSATVAVLNYIR